MLDFVYVNIKLYSFFFLKEKVLLICKLRGVKEVQNLNGLEQRTTLLFLGSILALVLGCLPVILKLPCG